MAKSTAAARQPASRNASTRRNPPRSRRRTTARRTPARRSSSKAKGKSLKQRRDEHRQKQAKKKRKLTYARLHQGVMKLVNSQETEQLARETGFYQRVPQEIHAFEFAICCAFAAMVEQKRGFASVWRIMVTVAEVEVARSAVTQRFGTGSAALLESLFFRALDRLPAAQSSEQRAKLNMFRQVLAQDGTVLQLAPLLEKLFPATRTNVVKAAAKVHVAADLLDWRIVDVSLTGERDSELDEMYKVHDFQKNTLYLLDLGYYSHDLFSLVQHSEAFVLMRLKDNANPTVVQVREGIRRPRASEGQKLKEVQICKTAVQFDLDAEFLCSEVAETVTMRVVGLWNPETQRYHRYVTNLPADTFTVEDLSELYRQRWIIELLMKLLKSHCHLDHLDTKDPDALRTHIYASLLAAVVLQSLMITAAKAAGIGIEQISHLTVGIAAPLIAVPLILMWLEREITYDELSAMIFRTVAHGCRDQNPRRSRENARSLR
jgi:IS4 transposase